MIALLLAGCWPWIPTPEDPDGLDNESDIESDTESDSESETETDVESDTESDTDPPEEPAWRVWLGVEQFYGSGGPTRLKARLCVDGRVGAAWWSRLIDAPGACHATQFAADGCNDGTAVSATVTGLSAPLDLPYDAPSMTMLSAETTGPSSERPLSLTTTSWPEGTPALDLADVVTVRPTGTFTVTQNPPPPDHAEPHPHLFGTEDTTLSWSGVSGGSVFIRIVGQGAPYASVRCLVDASDGSVTVPAAIFDGWVDQTASYEAIWVSPTDSPVADGLLPQGIDQHILFGWVNVHTAAP